MIYTVTALFCDEDWLYTYVYGEFHKAHAKVSELLKQNSDYALCDFEYNNYRHSDGTQHHVYSLSNNNESDECNLRIELIAHFKED